MDALIVAGSAMRLAEFTDPDEQSGVYPYAAAAANEPGASNKIALMPYDLATVLNAPGWSPPAGYEGIPARAIILEDILFWFGAIGGEHTGRIPESQPFAVRSQPNPFNPRTTFELVLPRDCDVSLKIFDLRGALVRTLVAGRLESGVHEIVWEGKNDGGRPAASGVYFAETRAGDEVRISKMALVR